MLIEAGPVAFEPVSQEEGEGQLPNGKATSTLGRGFALQRTKMLLDRGGEDVCSIA